LIALATLPACRISPEAKEAKYLKRGEALAAKKDYPRAVLEFRNAAIAMPKDAEPYYRMGLAYLESGDFQTAVGMFQRAVSLNQAHRGAQLKLAELMTVSRDGKFLEQAVARVVLVFGLSPDNPEAIDTLAVAEWKLGRPEDAFQRLEEALKRFPTHLQSSVTLARMKFSKSDWKGAEEVLTKAVADAPQSSPAALALGELYILMGQPAKAESELKRAIQLDPKNGAALSALGVIQVAAKRMNEAEQTYKQLAALPEKNYKPSHALFVYQFGRREAAVAEFKALANADPNDRQARTRLVAAYFGMNRVPEAEDVLAAALKRNPKDTDALLQRAELRLRAGKADDAEQDVKEALHFIPDSPVAHFWLAEAYRVKGLQNSQQQELEQTLRLDPTMLGARLALEMNFLAAKQTKTALEVMDAAPEAQKKQLQWIVGRNWALLLLGKLQEASVGIDQALQKGRPAEAVFQNAALQFLQRDYAGARAHLEELVKRDVTDVQVAQLLMETYAAQQDLAKGVDRLKLLVAAHPNSAPLQHLLGQWYNRTGNSTDARKAFESAKAADPKFAAADLSLAQMEMNDGRNDAALHRLGAMITADPKNVASLLLSARAAEAAGDHASVIARYRAVLNADSSNVIALNNLAYALARDNPDEALKFAEQALEIAPGNPTVQDTLGLVYYRKGIYDKAVDYLKSAVQKEPTPDRQFHLALSYLKSGDRLQGQKLLATALQQDPNLLKTERGW
jgi:tetratricopeptide (TPR) repeat protein